MHGTTHLLKMYVMMSAGLGIESINLSGARKIRIKLRQVMINITKPGRSGTLYLVGGKFIAERLIWRDSRNML